MSDHSRIEWTEATWNPVTGCSKVSQGCKNCYALREWPRLAAPRPKPNIYTGRAFTDVRCHPERLDQPLRWTKPRRVFVNSMSDLFHEDIPDAFIDRVFAVMALTPRHTYQVLTKRPERMRDYLSGGTIDTHGMRSSYRRDSIIVDTIRWDQANERLPGHGLDGAPWPLENVWLGVSVEDQTTADERIPLLLQTPAAVRWISAEPCIGPIDLTSIPIPPDALFPAYGTSHTFRFNALHSDDETHMHSPPHFINWVVVGGESGPNARPMHPEWARSLRDQCQAAGVPYFFKQWGEWKPQVDYYDHEHTDRDEWCDVACEDPRVRLITRDGHDWVVGVPGNGRHDGQPPAGTWVIERTGKKAAGRELDGRTWEEYPTCPA